MLTLIEYIQLCMQIHVYILALRVHITITAAHFAEEMKNLSKRKTLKKVVIKFIPYT